MNTVLVTRLETAFDRKLAEAFAREGYRCFALAPARAGTAGASMAGASTAGDGEATGVELLPGDLARARSIIEERAGKIDLYIDVSDTRDPADCFTIRDGLDEKVIRGVYEANVLRPMAALETFLPLLDAGTGKRLCFLTSAEASVNETRGVHGYAYKMSKAAMHNFFQMIANRLTPMGYTFRVYDPMNGEAAPEAAAEGALNYFVRRRGTERENPLRDDETRLVFRDALGREHTW